MAVIVDTSTLDSTYEQFSDSEIYWLYNGLDVTVTHDVLAGVSLQLDDVARATYAHSMELTAPFMEMSLRGFAVDLQRRQEIITHYDGVAAHLQSILDRYTAALGYEKPLSVNSPKQLQEFFHSFLGLKEKRKRKKGADSATVSLDRAVLEALGQAYLIAEPFVKLVLAIRDAKKASSFAKTKFDADNRMRCNFNIAGTNTGRLSSSVSDMGTGCVRPTAEALTPSGWKPLSSLVDGDLIAQWDKGEISFVPATFFRTEAEGLLSFRTEQTGLSVTREHRVLSADARGVLTVLPARAAAARSTNRIPLCGEYHGGVLTYPPYLAMLMADFSKEGTIWRGGLYKPRKIERARELLTAYGVEFWESPTGRPGGVRFNVRAPMEWPKHWGDWVLSVEQESLSALVEEARHWDSHSRGESFIFFSAYPETAEWFATACHLTGRSTTTRSARNSDAAYGNNSLIYSVNVKPRQFAQVLRKHWTSTPYSGPVMCPQVPSSFWLVREEGMISVTGNTNLQNVNGRLKELFLADEGDVLFDIDLEQGDSRGVGAGAWEFFHDSHGPEWAGRYLDACESGDLHTAVCRLAWPHLAWDNPDLEGKALSDYQRHVVAAQLCYREKSYRDMSKVLSHGTNYLGQPATMSGHTKVPVDQISLFQHNYFQGFPCIKEWQNETIRLLQTTAQLTTLFGRRRYFWDDLEASSTINAAIAYCPQSVTGEFCNRGILQLQRVRNARDLPVKLHLQVHDSMVLGVRFKGVHETMREVMKAIRVVRPLKGGRAFSIPHGFKMGWNYGSYDPETNPYGMKKYDPQEERTPPPARKSIYSLLDLPATSIR